MKKRALTFAFLLLGTLAFVSCEKVNTEDDGVIEGVDELAYLQGHFVGFDEDQMPYVRAGWQLNEADPHELSMKADSFEAAAAIFKKIILPEANVKETENSLIWHLTGEDGKAQGDAVLSKESGDKVAVLSLPAAATLVNRVNFIPHSLWPENGEQEYRDELDDFFFCNVVKIKTNLTQKPGSIFCRGNHGTGNFLVIREYDQETNTWGIALRLPARERTGDDTDIDLKYAPTYEKFEEVRKIYLDNKEIFDKEMDKAGFASRDDMYLVKKGEDAYLYKFSTGYRLFKINFYHKECLIYYFGFGTYGDNQYSSYLIVQ